MQEREMSDIVRKRQVSKESSLRNWYLVAWILDL